MITSSVERFVNEPFHNCYVLLNKHEVEKVFFVKINVAIETPKNSPKIKSKREF